MRRDVTVLWAVRRDTIADMISLRVGVLWVCGCAAWAAAWPEPRFVRVFSGVVQPTHIATAGDGSGRLFFVEQAGRIRVARNGALLSQPFLDISGRVSCCGERGLFSVAFPPNFAAKQYFYVDYTDVKGNTVVSRFSVTADPDVADAASETPVLGVVQPFANHNGGQLAFGPDGYLYVGMGDGGGGGDPMGNGQNLGTLLGKLLRIDVEAGVQPFQAPADNPFVNNSSARAEIWAYGLRNPWRFSFDRQTGDLYTADVGQDAWEEVDFQPSSSHGGENYGWNRTEGAHCFSPPSCSLSGITLPVAEYSHAEGCSVTGGFVYRGARYPAWQGVYFYGDFCSGRVWGLQRTGGTWQNQLLATTSFNITTFGQHEQGELYLADAGKGDIYALVAPASIGSVVNAASGEPGISPGSIASIFGTGLSLVDGVAAANTATLPTELAGTTVTVNGTPAPLLAVANVNGREQINFQAPYSLAGADSASVGVAINGVAAPAATVAVLGVQPGIFSADGVHAAAQHAANYALVSAADPAQGGEVVLLYGTGFGAVSNAPQTGKPAAPPPFAEVTSGLTVSIGGQSADVLFAGLAPGLAGVYQVNTRVPGGLGAGDNDLVITVGGRSSPVVELPVR